MIFENCMDSVAMETTSLHIFFAGQSGVGCTIGQSIHTHSEFKKKLPILGFMFLL